MVKAVHVVNVVNVVQVDPGVWGSAQGLSKCIAENPDV